MLSDTLLVLLTSSSSIIVLFLLTKLIGKKQMSELDIFDYIVGISIGSIAAEMATDIDGFHKPLVALIIYALFNCVVSFAATKSIKFRRFINNTPTILYSQGKIYNQNMSKVKINVNEFLYQCRTNGYFDLTALHTIIMEPNGKLSFLPIASQRPMNPGDMNLAPNQEKPLANIIIDGNIMYDNLNGAGFNEAWLNDRLKDTGTSVKKIFLATCDTDGKLTVYEKQSRFKKQNFFD